MYPVHSKLFKICMYAAHHALNIVHCLTVHSALYTLQLMLYTVHSTLYIVRHTLYTVPITVYTVHFTLKV